MKKLHIIIVIAVLISAFALIGFFAMQNREELEDAPGFDYMPAAAAAAD